MTYDVGLSCSFHQRDAMLARYLSSSYVCPSVRPSVRPSKVVLFRRLNLG